MHHASSPVARVLHRPRVLRAALSRRPRGGAFDIDREDSPRWLILVASPLEADSLAPPYIRP